MSVWLKKVVEERRRMFKEIVTGLVTIVLLLIPIAVTTTEVYAQQQQQQGLSPAARQIIDTARADCAGVTAGLPDLPAELEPVFIESCLSLVHESANTVVITGDLLITTGSGLYTDNLAIWKAVDGFKAQGFTTDNILLGGQGSQGNPHRLYVVMSK
jgi:hypothetical protein